MRINTTCVAFAQGTAFWFKYMSLKKLVNWLFYLQMKMTISLYLYTNID